MNALVAVQPNYDVNDIWKMAQAVAKSGLFGMKQPEQAMALMLVAQAEGTHPALAARDYHIVDGRPTLKADAMLARFMQAGGRVEWLTYDDREVKATFSHPQGGKVTVEWTFARAAQIMRKGKALTEGDNWRNYPRAMLRARVISEGIRTVFPGCVVGVYTPEEAQDFDEPRNVTPPRSRVAPEPQAGEVIDAVVEVVTEKPEEHGLFIACKAAIDLGQTKADLQQWATNNEASLAKIKADDPAVYEAILTYWRSRLKAAPKDAPQPQSATDEFGLDGDDVPEFN